MTSHGNPLNLPSEDPAPPLGLQLDFHKMKELNDVICKAKILNTIGSKCISFSISFVVITMKRNSYIV